MNYRPQYLSLEVAGDTLIFLYERVFPYILLNVWDFFTMLFTQVKINTGSMIWQATAHFSTCFNNTFSHQQ